MHPVELSIKDLDLLAAWGVIKSGSVSVELEGVGSFTITAAELVMDIENPKVWYDLFQFMAPALQQQLPAPVPKPRRMKFFPLQLLDTYKSVVMDTVRTVPTADLLLRFTETIRGLATALQNAQKTVTLHYFGVKIFKLGYRASGFVPTLVGAKHIEVVDYLKMLEFLNDLALQTNFFTS